jgi:hypothetical protein
MRCKRKLRGVIAFFVVIFAGACTTMTPEVTFEFRHGASPDAPTFRATTADPELIARVRRELQQPFENRSLHINGVIGAGSDGNAPWNWHFEPDAWDIAGISIALCDGSPSRVDENPERWVREFGRYCPWSSRVWREL